MATDDYTADDALPPGFTVEGPNGSAVVRAFWETASLADLQREADSHRNLHPDADLGDDA
ncbi:hypothetical protein [Dietzia natronolimnaea]|uniref:hypothetical protein n=1 Tax=Dietzia natronolimnaea TaxID=161920 RepID=UPI0015F84D84|nr:hypothetical protein [Dietzia natronolimnaea]MBB1037837.1 hypothetical protein [Dietzia natronolimnaea]